MSNFLQLPEVIAAIAGAIVGGVIGILGSVATLIITNILKNRGKLIVFTNDSKITFQRRDQTGGTVEVAGIIEAEDITIRIVIDVYNQADTPKNLANFKVEICHKKTKKEFDTKERQIVNGEIPFAVPVPTKTIYPKMPETIRCNTYLKPADFSGFQNASVYLLATYPDGRKFREKVLDVRI